jgi:hypothetical protein
MVNTRKKFPRGILDQVISNPEARTAAGRRAPDPGLKQVNTIVWFFQDHKWKQRHASVKRQVPSVKHQAPIFRKLQAASHKRQASSAKRQASQPE